jgi:hypothetical protein
MPLPPPITAMRTSSFLVDSVTYTLFHMPAGWSNAQSMCRSWGLELAAIVSESQASQLNSQFKTAFGVDESYWVGLSDSAQEGTFVWADGSANMYLRWSPSEPNGTTLENCVLVQSQLNGTWADAACSTKKPFICKSQGGYQDC